jgi:hypothetical protein
LPGEVHEFRVRAYRDDFCARLYKFLILLRQSSKFRGSDEGEVRGIEEKDGPFFCRFLRGKADLAEISLRGFVGLQFEVRDRLAYLNAATLFRHGVYLPKYGNKDI